jgi:predicted SprT family Zn-dependent metalloprotease
MIYRKRTHKDVTDAQVLAIWHEVLAETKKLYPHYFETCTPELYVDSSYNHLGRCMQTFQNPSERNVDKIRCSRCIITISSNLGTDYQQIRKTICHELGHFVSPKENHGRLWKVRADKIGARWQLESSRLTYHEAFCQTYQQHRAQSAKYRLYCPECGAQWTYTRACKATQHPEWYRCGKCKANLKVEKI